MSVATGITSAKDRRISPVPVSLVGLPAKAILIQSAGGSRQSVEQDDQHLWWQATISYKHLQTIQQVLVKLQKDRIWIILVKSCETGFRKIEILKLGLFWWGLPKPNFIICQWGSPRHLKKGTAVPRGCFWARCCARYHQSLASESRRDHCVFRWRNQVSQMTNANKNHTIILCVHLSFCMLFWYAHLYFRFQTVVKRYHSWSGSAHVLGNRSQLKTSFTSQV